MTFLKKLIQFLKDVSQDPQIPERDKLILASLITLIISPIDLIPDWIPILGQLDDLVMISIVMDYFFKVLDSEVLLRHWPWSLKGFTRLRAISRILQVFVPKFVKKKLWKYVGKPY